MSHEVPSTTAGQERVVVQCSHNGICHERVVRRISGLRQDGGRAAAAG